MMKFTEPNMEIVLFSESDVIRTTDEYDDSSQHDATVNFEDLVKHSPNQDNDLG